MGRLFGFLAATALAACSASSGNSSSSSGGFGSKACVGALAGCNGGCTLPNRCITAPVLACIAVNQCPAPSGYVCRDVPMCQTPCDVSKCSCAYPTDGGFTCYPAFSDGGLGCTDCTSYVPQSYCVNDLCQACGSDSDCTDGTSCIDENFHVACNVPSDCPGAQGDFDCE